MVCVCVIDIYCILTSIYIYIFIDIQDYIKMSDASDASGCVLQGETCEPSGASALPPWLDISF